MADAVKTKRTRRVILRNDPYRDQRPAGFLLQGVKTIVGTQMTESEGHPWKKHSRFKGEDVGGDFYTIRRKMIDNRGDAVNPTPQFHYHVTGSTPDRDYIYTGPLYPINPASTSNTPFGSYWPPDLSYSDSQLMGLGATAIARCDPTKSPANLSVALAELIREGIPKIVGHSLWEARNKLFSSLGDEYLNVQFGWLPFLADIKDSASAILDMDKLMRQYERDSGRLVRRGYTFPTIREQPIVDQVQVDPNKSGLWTGSERRPAAGYVQLPGAKTVLSREIERKLWFAGGFTYYLPSDYESRTAWQKKLYLARQLLGLEITPETLWNLTPWSWAADWFTNIGDNMHNISSFASDGLVLRYGYLMEHTIIKDTYTATGYILNGYGSTPLQLQLITEVKKRRRATPFGFGVDKGSLTTRQLSILAALGISRL